MIDRNTKTELRQSAMDVDARAMDFLIERSLGDWAAADRAALNVWLDESPAHRIAYWRLESVWTRADRLAVLRFSTRDESVPSTARRWRTLLGIGILAIAALAAVMSYLVSLPHSTIYATATGEQRSVHFADGTRVDLNTATVIRAAMDTRYRAIELIRGEAVFHVKHNAAHPLIVVAAGSRITDLGTEFLVRNNSGNLKVALIEGRARLESDIAGRAQNHIAILLAGDEAIASVHGLSVVRKTQPELLGELAWQHGELVFHHATLVEVAGEYNRYNRRKIIIADSEAGARIINATLPTNDVDAFARMAQNFLGLHVSENGDEIVISR